MALALVERNVLSNFLARIWNGLLSIALIPIYIEYIGVEAYGMVGIFISLQTLLLLLDLGLGATISREFARFSGVKEKAEYLIDLTRTLEIVYLATGILIALVMVNFAAVITNYWLSPEGLSPETVTTAIKLIGLTIAVQWPSALYSGGMSGLQTQVRLSILVSAFATLRYGGAIIVLHFLSPTIDAFFGWQLIVGILQTLTLRYNLMQVLPPCEKSGSIQLRILVPLWRFATGMLGISILSTLITQLDKVILSKLLSLEEFGYYTIATAVASSLYMAVAPTFNAFYPKFSKLYQEFNTISIEEGFHQGNQILAVILFPLMWLFVFYSPDILLAWTGKPDLASIVAFLVVPLVIGNTINGMMNIPYALQLGAGWTRIPLLTNLVGLAFLIPALLHVSTKYGAIGAAYVWLLFNIIYMIITIVVMHRLVSKIVTYRWLVSDIGQPLAASFIFFGFSYFFVDNHVNIFTATLLTSLSFICAVISAPLVKSIFTGLSIRTTSRP